MKKLFAFLFVAAAFVACTEDAPETPPVPPTITIETPEPEAIPDEGGEAVVEFVAPEPWVIEIDATRADEWVTVEPMSGDAGNAQIKITTAPNDTYDDREATITIKAGTMQESITVKQSQMNGLVAAEKEFEIDFKGGVVDFEIETNVDLTITISDDAKEWIKEASATRGLEKKALSFEIAPHMSTADRTGEITIAGGGLEQKITINQVYPVPNDEIWYTTTDEQVAAPSVLNAINVAIVSNEYKDGKGVIKFDGDVTTIGQNAFAAGGKNKNLKTILLPKSITEIGNYAFAEGVGPQTTIYTCPITEIIIPENVTKLGTNPFRNCLQLTAFYGKYASKDGKSLIKDDVLVSYAIGEATEVTIPDGVKEIGAYLFYNTAQLTKVNYSSSVTTIGERAFSANNLIHTEDSVLSNAPAIASIDIPVSITTIGSSAFANNLFITEINIPSNVTTIGERAFASCENVETLTIAEGVKQIGNFAFEGMGLAEVTIPSSIETIGINPFSLNMQLQSFKGKYATADNVALIKDGVFVAIVCNKWFDEYNIPEGVTELGGAAFKDIRNFGIINIPASVTKVNDYAFTGQSNATINWTDNITEVGLQSFSFCFMGQPLEELALPANLTTIGERAFYQIGTKNLTIPAGVTSIGKYAFSYSYVLEAVKCLATTPPTIDATAFLNIANLTTIAVPAASVDAYKAADGWKDLADKIVAIE